MTHYTVVVFDKPDKVEALLAPYDENIRVDWYKQGVVSADDIHRFVGFCWEKHPSQRALPVEELYALHGSEWHGSRSRWKFTPDGVEKWSTYNPKSKWDYYTITDARLPDFVPFAFVTPDGEWHAQGEMGWWDMHWDEKPDDEWEEEYQAALKKYRTRGYTIVDVHI